MKQIKRVFLEQIFVNIYEEDDQTEIEKIFSARGFYLKNTQYVASNPIGTNFFVQITFERNLDLSSFTCLDCGYEVQPEEFFKISE